MKKTKTLFTILMGFGALLFAGAALLAALPAVVLPQIADVMHVSVDTLAHFVQFAFGGSGLTAAACTLSGYTEACDDEGNTAGIASIWFASKNDVQSLTFNATGQLSTITMVSGKVFYQWTFDPDTAFFNQPKSVSNKSPFVKQSIQFTNPKMSTDLINAIDALDACAICGLVAIVKDNNGKFWLAGVKYFSSGTYTITGLYPAQSDGAVTGANPEGDVNKITTAFESKTGKYARESVVAEASIPV